MAAAVFRPRHDYLPGTDVFRSVDVETVSQKLNLDARGAADARAGIPDAKDKTLTVTEREIVAHLENTWDETLRDAKAAYDAYHGQFRSFTADTEIDVLLAEPRAAALRLKQIARDEADQMHLEFEEVRSGKAELARFKKLQGIEHEPARGQDIQQKMFWIALAVLAEFVVNIGIFGMADAQGFAGAAPKVLVIPILNIGGSFAISFMLMRRLLVRRSGFQIALGVLGVGLAAVWLLGLNLIVAHWRDAYGSEIEVDAGVAALRAVLDHPLQLVSLNSWALFFIGAAAGGIALYEGWFWEDPFPGYAERRKRLEDAQASFLSARADALKRLQDEADLSANHLGSEQRRAAEAIASRPALSARAASLAEDVGLYAAHLERVANDLFARYREANVAARETERPAYFEEPAPVSFKAPKFAALEADADARKVAGKLAAALNEITDAHEEACRALPSLRELEETSQ